MNELLRAGLAGAVGKASRRRRYRVRSVSLGPPRLPNLDNVAEVLAVADGEDAP